MELSSILLSLACVCVGYFVYAHFMTKRKKACREAIIGKDVDFRIERHVDQGYVGSFLFQGKERQGFLAWTGADDLCERVLLRARVTCFDSWRRVYLKPLQWPDSVPRWKGIVTYCDDNEDWHAVVSMKVGLACYQACGTINASAEELSKLRSGMFVEYSCYSSEYHELFLKEPEKRKKQRPPVCTFPKKGVKPRYTKVHVGTKRKLT